MYVGSNALWRCINAAIQRHQYPQSIPSHQRKTYHMSECTHVPRRPCYHHDDPLQQREGDPLSDDPRPKQRGSCPYVHRAASPCRKPQRDPVNINSTSILIAPQTINPRVQATLPPVDSITMAEILVCKYICPSDSKLMKRAFLWLGNNRGWAGDFEDRHRGLRVQGLAGGDHHGQLWQEDPLHLPRVGTAGKLDLKTALL